MIDERFSAAAFEAADEQGRMELVEQLKAEVSLLLAPTLEDAMREIVRQLNDLGHELVDEEYEPVDEICYDTPKGGHWRLYLCHDSTVSAGGRSSEVSGIHSHD
jgi:hypothetical protein